MNGHGFDSSPVAYKPKYFDNVQIKPDVTSRLLFCNHFEPLMYGVQAARTCCICKIWRFSEKLECLTRIVPKERHRLVGAHARTALLNYDGWCVHFCWQTPCLKVPTVYFHCSQLIQCVRHQCLPDTLFSKLEVLVPQQQKSPLLFWNDVTF